MILIGEKLNSSIPSTLEAFEARNEAAVLSLIQLQEKAGAAYLDVNTSLCANEQDALLWVAGLIRAHSKCGIMIDTADPEVMAQAVQAAQGTDFILNSATIDERFEEVTALAKKSNAALVALPISLEGQEPGLRGRCANIDKLIGKLRQAGIPDKHIFLDVLAETLATDTESAKNNLWFIQCFIWPAPPRLDQQRIFNNGCIFRAVQRNFRSFQPALTGCFSCRVSHSGSG